MTKRIELPVVDQAALQHYITTWEPPVIPHCSNCRHATIGEGQDAHCRIAGPVASCAMGHGQGAISLFRLIRPKRPRGFRSAIKCPDFVSMSDEDTPCQS